jgi:TolB-like protein/DNA-binding winged helix-turn-helix (wHTH) protein/Tfp pilus assembly protein PilF
MPQSTIIEAPEGCSRYTVGDLTVDVGRARVSRADTEIPLPKLSFDLLHALVEAAPNLVTADELVNRVWAGLVVSSETVSQRVKLLRSALGDDARRPRYIAAVRSRGYRLVADVAPADAPVATSEREHPPVAAPKRFPRWWLGVAAGVATVVVLAVAVLRLEVKQDVPAPAEPDPILAAEGPPSIAVLPFENLSGSSDNDVLALGLAESVLHQLANLREITAIARTSSFASVGGGDDARAIGRQLNARYLLAGSVQSDAAHLRVTARLVDAKTGRHVWSMRFDKTPQDIFAVQDEIALEVAKALELTLDSRSSERLAGQGTMDFDAYLAFMQGRAVLNTLNVVRLPTAISYLERAIRSDPGFASAYVELAGAKVRLAEYAAGDDQSARFAAALESANALIAKALELDPQSGEAYIRRGYLRAFTDLAGAEADFRRGLELQPNSVHGFEGLAAALFQDPTRVDEARAMLDRVRELNPLEPRHDVTMFVLLLYAQGNVEEAERSVVSALRKDPLYHPALIRLGELRWFLGASAEAARYGEQALTIDPQSDWTRRYLLRAYLEMGDPAAAQDIVDGASEPVSAHRVPLHLYRREWDLAGEAAYASVEAGSVLPIDAFMVVLAIRMYARATGDYARARSVLEEWSETTLDEQGRPVSGEPLGMRVITVGLADILQQIGDEEGARHLLKAVLADMDYETRELGRNDLWHFHSRPMALALLGRYSAAVDLIERYMQGGVVRNDSWSILEFEPVLEPVRSEQQFQRLLATARANATEQYRRVVQLRQDGVVPARSGAHREDQ